MSQTAPEGFAEALNRRDFLRLAGLAGTAVLVGAAAPAAAAPVTELQAIPFKDSLTRMEGISETTVREHWKLYQGYVTKTNELRAALAALPPDAPANATYSPVRELKVELTFALNGAKNHAIYFDHLGGRGGRPSGALLRLIERDFGSYEQWQNDLQRSGLAARGWAWLVYDMDLQRLLNVVGDSQNTYPIWNAVPLVALDVYEHAYWLDYQTNRANYIQAFFANLDWDAVQARAERFRVV